MEAAILQCKEIRQIWLHNRNESNLKKLQNTVTAIKSVLLDVDAKEEFLTHQQRDFVDKLKTHLYDADDLFDEFNALAQQGHHHPQDEGVFSKMIHLVFDRSSIWDEFYDQVNELITELDGIANDASKFNFQVNYEPIRNRSEDSCSYVYESHVIGRDNETDEIINMLLAPNADDAVVAIVGIGGMGKTALAQILYNHHILINEFHLRFWVCVADQDSKQLPVQHILAKVLELATRNKQDDESGIELLQTKLREQLQGKKYLLVLDDVWTESRIQWLNLQNFLMGAGARGSRIIITTRSENTAKAVGSITPYKLQGLSDENSWLLFERVAFGGDEEQSHLHELEKIGREIVKKCSNVPLCIRVIGTLLYGQERRKWLHLQQHGVAGITEEDNTIMQTLKLSYHHLQPAMKSCFSYCALFPKDSVMEKETLISLWMAQGYIDPSSGKSLEDIGEDYFQILLRRCFFQDVEKDEYGEIVSCKMHDLIHDMAQQVTGKEICVVDSTTKSLDERVRHVYIDCYNCHTDFVVGETKIRTYIHEQDSIIQTILTKSTRLRVLKLKETSKSIRCLPNNISKLLHLRYLDLSENRKLEKLPKSVTKLHYLQTLILRGCSSLKELPKGFDNLVNLRVLDIEGCEGISRMPLGMNKLTNLIRLSTFIVNEEMIGSGSLDDLRALKDLRGHLTLYFPEKFRYDEEGEGGYLINKEHLTSITMWLGEGNRALLEDLQPHGNLKVLSLYNYRDERMPSWALEQEFGSSFPNLVNISLYGCYRLEELPSFSKLPNLKRLQLERLPEVEHMESSSSTRSAQAPFFPSLQTLKLRGMKKLKGWWRGSDAVGNHESPSFPFLSQLYIIECPNLESIMRCPMVEIVELYKFNDGLQIKVADEKDVSCYSGSLRSLWVDNGRCLESLLPMIAFHNLQEMIIRGDNEIESLSQVGEEVFRNCSSSLRSLKFLLMDKLGNLGGGGLEHLTALESLELFMLPEVKKLPNGMKRLTSLQSLTIGYDVELEGGLPEWIGCLSSLHSLTIRSCRRIERMAESMKQLTSLTTLYLRGCSERLKERCKSPDGEDWPNIQHIPNIDIR